MNPFQSLYRCYRGYFNFSGRATRADYNWFAVWIVTLALCIGPLNDLISNSLQTEFDALQALEDKASPEYSEKLIRNIKLMMSYTDYTFFGFIALIFIPGYAVAVRRGHDIGIDGMTAALMFLTIIGMVRLAYVPGDESSNEYGSPP